MRLFVPIVSVLVLVLLSSSSTPGVSGGEPPAVRARSVEVAYGFSCVVLVDGSAQCWGYNSDGMLGDGTRDARRAPVRVVGLEGPVDRLALSDVTTCALYESDDVGCWGYGREGQLGDGKGSVRSLVPVSVVGLGGPVTDLGAGQLHTCAVLDSGNIQCWGENEFGQLGTGDTDDAFEPATVQNLGNAVQVDGGIDAFACAVTSAAAAVCWGLNDDGSLGDGTDESSKVPVGVSGLGSNVDVVSAGGDHACAIMSDRTIKCWGRNYEGQLGTGEANPGSLVPVDVDGIDDAVQVSAGEHHTCALTLAQEIWCWGHNEVGQLGDGTHSQRNEPKRITSLTNIVDVAAGGRHTCAVDEEGRVYCWGANNEGQLGTGTLDPSDVPVEVVLAEPPEGDDRIWGDDDCDGDVDSVDSLKNLRFVAALSVSQEKGCPGFGQEVRISDSPSRLWADVDCDGDIDSVDALKILRHVAALTVNQPKGCAQIGAEVSVEARH